MVDPPRRHLPCTILREKSIPCLVWFEDAIAPYGVPTVVFDLYLLVPDIEEAARVLINDGWVDAGPSESIYYFLEGPVPQRRLNPPPDMMAQRAEAAKAWPPPPPTKHPPGPTTTVLLPAPDWNVAVENLQPSTADGFVPPLPLLLDGLIQSLLDSPTDTALRSHLSVQLNYLYRHCRTLKTQDFAENLRLEHRQFHYDALSKVGLGTVPFVAEQRQIRDEIREGKRQPQRNSWYLPPGSDGGIKSNRRFALTVTSASGFEGKGV